MDIKKFIQNPKVKSLKGNQFKFLLELYSMTNKDGIIEEFTIISFSEKAKVSKTGHSTSRNSLAKYIKEFQELHLLVHDRYKKTITFI